MSLNNQTRECFYPHERNEISPDAQIIINLFGRLKRSRGEEEQRELAQLFYTQLVELITPKGEGHFQENSKELIKILLENSAAPNNYISVGSGTDGHRIWFKNGIRVPSEEEVRRLGKDAIVEKEEDDCWLRSKDGFPRWMAYYKPSSSSWPYGEKYWNRFMDNFGHPVVDLLPPQ